MLAELPHFSALKKWLKDNGGGFHEHVHFKFAGIKSPERANNTSTIPTDQIPRILETSGNAAIATEELPANTTIVSCPLSLVITEELAQRNLSKRISKDNTLGWTERQWICTYICLHWVLSDSNLPELGHYPYINTLPLSGELRTPLHFTELEQEAFRGSNLYHATIDRKRMLMEEWKQCQSLLASTNTAWGQDLTWERYLSVATHLSSRAFPSSILSPTPTLQTTPLTKPVLIPGVDSLNHKRGHPVSWTITYPVKSDHPTSSNSQEVLREPTISLILHNKTLADKELFNNYGLKPNAELILGYGFSLPNNPDDTILLKIGGSEGRWEIGRLARGAEALWDEVVRLMGAHGSSSDGESAVYEIRIDAASMLADMVQNVLEKLPSETVHEALRPEVSSMLRDYVNGQREILTSLLDFCKEKEEASIELARSLGVELVIED